MQVTEEMLMAYVDGELSEADRRRVEAAVSASPEVADKLADYERTARLARIAYDDIARSAVPAAIMAALEPPKVVRLRDRMRVPNLVPVAMAASLGMAAGLGLALTWADVSPDRAGAVAGPLARALDTVGSGKSMSAGGDHIMVTASFPQRGGGWCREYRIDSGRTGASGIACRADQNGWRVAVHYPWTPPEAAPGTISPSSGAAPPEVEMVADTLVAGTRLDEAKEQALIARGWKN